MRRGKEHGHGHRRKQNHATCGAYDTPYVHVCGYTTYARQVRRARASTWKCVACTSWLAVRGRSSASGYEPGYETGYEPGYKLWHKKTHGGKKIDPTAIRHDSADDGPAAPAEDEGAPSLIKPPPGKGGAACAGASALKVPTTGGAEPAAVVVAGPPSRKERSTAMSAGVSSRYCICCNAAKAGSACALLLEASAGPASVGCSAYGSPWKPSMSSSRWSIFEMIEPQ